jgi:hypothetical protein
MTGPFTKRQDMASVVVRESIPKKWVDPDSKPPKTYDLTEKDLAVPAVFTSDPLISLRVKLIPSEGKKNEATGVWEKTEGTGCTLVFQGCKKLVYNKRLLQLLMADDVYERGMVRPDPEDPTGFWRQQGVIEVKVIETAKFESGSHPSFDELNLKELKAETDVKPLRVIK